MQPQQIPEAGKTKFLDIPGSGGSRWEKSGKKSPEPLPAPGKSLGRTFRARHPSIPRLLGITGLSGSLGLPGWKREGETTPDIPEIQLSPIPAFPTPGCCSGLVPGAELGKSPTQFRRELIPGSGARQETSGNFFIPVIQGMSGRAWIFPSFPAFPGTGMSL